MKKINLGIVCIFTVGKPGGRGRFANLWGNVDRATDKTHAAYLRR